MGATDGSNYLDLQFFGSLIMLKKIFALAELARPLNCILTGISVIVGAVCNDLFIFEEIFFQINKNSSTNLLSKAILSAMLINAAGNAINDWCDKSIDEVNRPDRPLPAGRLKSSSAVLFSAITCTMGIILSILVSPIHFLITIFISALLLAYSLWLKNSILYGNLLVGLVSSATFPFGALALGEIQRSWIPAGFALFFHIGREIIKDVEDIQGDQMQGLKTFPIIFGVPATQKITVVIFLILALFTLLPFYAKIYGSIYFAIVLIYNALVIFVLYLFIHTQTKIVDGHLGRMLKIAMFVGLTAIAAGEFERSFLKSSAF